jgi:P27 family predicted phage terminase small subunit
MGILARVDRDALTAYCQTYSRWKAAEQFLEKHGEVYPVRDEHGNVRCMQQFPQVAISRNLLQVLQRYQQEFGMTPSARTRVQVIPDVVNDPDEERIFGLSRGPWK